ncbi:unnamed protein product [Rangifer tarandus platyrhynchus]|uniref:Uncharacterized protein n=2 Tax=Rangifer tarandus platyrhynchus TaxID=3082113 RepID=A0ABN8ZLW8_RANTA|nr:unnamed protein product [Rangifer tarandus platyrhynchus]CAI9708292.1 unnamed protein product [Rangifer tarandus platyrhynchus]
MRCSIRVLPWVSFSCSRAAERLPGSGRTRRPVRPRWAPHPKRVSGFPLVAEASGPRAAMGLSSARTDGPRSLLGPHLCTQLCMYEDFKSVLSSLLASAGPRPYTFRGYIVAAGPGLGFRTPLPGTQARGHRRTAHVALGRELACAPHVSGFTGCPWRPLPFRFRCPGCCAAPAGRLTKRFCECSASLRRPLVQACPRRCHPELLPRLTEWRLGGFSGSLSCSAKTAIS